MIDGGGQGARCKARDDIARAARARLPSAQREHGLHVVLVPEAVVHSRGHARPVEGDDTFLYRLPTANITSFTGQARKNSTCHWPDAHRGRELARGRRAHVRARPLRGDGTLFH